MRKKRKHTGLGYRGCFIALRITSGFILRSLFCHVQEAMERAHSILSKYDREHHRLAQALLERETLTAEEMRAVVAGRPLPPMLTGNVDHERKKKDKVKEEVEHGIPQPLKV